MLNNKMITRHDQPEHINIHNREASEMVNTTTRVIAAVIGLAAAVAVSACGTDTPRAQAPTVTATVTASATEPSDAGDDAGTAATEVDAADDSASGGGAPGPQPPPEPCGRRDLGAATINAAIAKIPAGGPGYAWQAGGSNFSTCNDISYVELDTVGATGSSPQQLLIFDRNAKFLGTGIKCNAGFQTVLGSTADTITVRYGYIKPGESTAGASGRAQVTFRWNGSRVVMDGTLPYGVTRGRC